MSDSFYRDFEDLFRGSRELIKSRLQVYLPFVRRLAALDAWPKALDLGCGRGEWLELLGENGFDASGVDLDEEMLAACHDRGLKVTRADLLKTLPGLPAQSVALISAFHVVEHLKFDEVRVLVSEALRILKPGGLLILETPNPENLSVGATSFYMDPSHIRPLPSSLLDFVLAHGGFSRTKVLFLQESADLHRGAAVRLIDVLNGVSPDYAVVGQKKPVLDLPLGQDEAFCAEYGLSLGTLAQRYDAHLTAQMDDRQGRSERRTAQAEHRLGLAEIHTAQVEDRLGQSERRTVQVEDRLARTEVRIEQLERQLHDMLNSSSWRVTAPLRWMACQARALRPNNLKARAKPLLRYSLSYAKGRGWLWTAVKTVLGRFPSLTARLRRVVHEAPGGAAPHATGPISAELAQLSARARRIFADLKAKTEQRRKESR